MKKTVLILMILIVFTLCAFGNVHAEESTKNDVGLGEKIYGEAENISLYHKDRTAGADGERKFAEYLIERLGGLGYEDYSYDFTFDNVLMNNASYTSRNVVFKKDAEGTDKHVIVMTGYSNLYGYEETKGNEAVYYGGAMGVSIMLTLAEKLKDIELGYDVYFVGLGANAMNYAGAGDFYEQFYIRNQKSDTLFVMNYTMPVGGDNIYMYTEETKTIHGEFLKKIAEESGSSFTKIPAYKKSAPILIRENQVIPYTHAGIFDSHIDFFNARIPSVNFLSLNWEKESFEAIEERDGSINISNQKEDNLEYLADKVGKEKILIQLSSVFDVSYNALTDKEFVDVMMKSAENMPDYSIINSDVFYFVTILISAIVVLSLAAFLVKRARNNVKEYTVDDYYGDWYKYFRARAERDGEGLEEEIAAIKEFVENRKKPAEDPFGLDSKDDGGNGDDIFGL